MTLLCFPAPPALAHKQIFTSLQGLIRDEGFNLPIVGAAKAGGNLINSKRAKGQPRKYGGLDQVAFNKLTGLCATRTATTTIRTLSPN